MTYSDDIPADWRGILRPNERILWQGAPAHDTSYDDPNVFSRWIGLAALVIFPIVLTRNMPDNPSLSHKLFLILLGVVMMGGAAWQGFGRSMFASYKLRHSFYTLTTARAFTGWNLFGHRHLDQWDINRHTRIDLQRLHHGSVYFAEKIHHSKNSSWTEKIGFLNIPDADKVYDLMLKVQVGTA